MTSHAKQFETIRQQPHIDKQVYREDGQRCPACNHLTETAHDAHRRYCTSTRCNAMVLE